MAYPEPVPILRGKDAEEFFRKLENFRLTDAQKAFYREGLRTYGPGIEDRGANDRPPSRRERR